MQRLKAGFLTLSALYPQCTKICKMKISSVLLVLLIKLYDLPRPSYIHLQSSN